MQVTPRLEIILFGTSILGSNQLQRVKKKKHPDTKETLSSHPSTTGVLFSQHLQKFLSLNITRRSCLLWASAKSVRTSSSKASSHDRGKEPLPSLSSNPPMRFNSIHQPDWTPKMPVQNLSRLLTNPYCGDTPAEQQRNKGIPIPETLQMQVQYLQILSELQHYYV